MPDLRRVGERVEIRGSRGVPSRLRTVSRDVAVDFLGGSVRVQCGVFGASRLEQSKDVLSALCCIAGHDAESSTDSSKSPVAPVMFSILHDLQAPAKESATGVPGCQFCPGRLANQSL